MDEPPRKEPRGQRRQDRGRPRRFADPQGPEREWLEDLSPTAAHIVKVASELLVEEGFEAVTIERVAHRANVAPPTVRRLFVSKASLVQAVFDQTELAAYKELIERVSDRPPRDRVDAYLRNLQTLIRPVSGVVTSTVLAHGLRDPITPEKIAADYEIARLNTMEDTGLTNSAEWGDGRPHPHPGTGLPHPLSR